MIIEKFPNALKVLDDIKYGRIQSATEATLSIVEEAINVIFKVQDIELIKGFIKEYFTQAIKARPANALLINILRKLLENIREPLLQGDLYTLRENITNSFRELKSNIERINELVAHFAVRRIEYGDTILTNSYSTTVITALKKAKQLGKNIRVFIAESRPGLEGLKAAKELDEAGIPVTLFVDSAVRYFMKEVDKVFVGAEAIAANGAVVSKVGTSLIALAAHEARVNVFVLASTLKFSPETIFGQLVELLEKEPESLVSKEKMKELGKVKIKVPIFDVTPPEYIDAIITEKGLIAPQAITLVIREIYGWPFRVTAIKELLGEEI